MRYFVSYTTKDKVITKELLTKFSYKLKENGEVYIDLIDNDSENKQERVLVELDKCDTFILIESKSIYNSNWVKIELDRAKYLKKEIKILSLESILNLLNGNDENGILLSI